MQGQNLDRAGACPCTDPQEHQMLQGQSSDPKQAACRASPVDQNRALHDVSSRNRHPFNESADFLPFGCSIEQRIDLKGSQYDLEGPI